MDAGGPVRAEREKRGPSASPPVPIKTYQWEEIRRARQQGGYPWTYLDKPPLEGAEITAEEVLRDTDPKMSRDNSRERKTPEPQKILMLDSSPGSSRKITEGEEESAPAAVHIPNFSKEISLDSEEDVLEKADPSVLLPENLRVEEAKVVNVSPKSILKRKHAEEKPPVAQTNTDESPRNSKCCHPLVEKIKHIADKTMHKQPKKDAPSKQKRKDMQEIIALDCSPGTERRERKKAAELEKESESQPEKSISFVMQNDEPIKNKEHVYEDMVVDAKEETEPSEKDMKKANDGDSKSGDSKDPSLMIDEEPMEDDDTVTEKITKLKNMYDTSMAANKSGEDITEGVVVEADDSPDPSKADDTGKRSPNLTITDVTDEEQQKGPQEASEDKKVHFEVGDDRANSTPPKEASDEEGAEDFWSKMSDHEYEPIGKPLSESELKAQAQEPPKPQQPPQQIQQLQKSAEPMPPPAPPSTPPPPSLYVSEPELAPKTYKDDDASSTTSHERQLLRPSTEDDTTHMDYEGGDDTEPPSSSMALQRQIEDRYFVNTPTTTTESRTDCEISTSQVDSSALENLPLKRENRKRNVVGEEASKLHQKIKNSTGKLKTKLKTIKKPTFNMPERPKFNLPERPKFTMPERPKFTMPERPKFNMPERPKMPKMPDRPKINLPDRPKFRMPERPKFNMPEKPKFLEKAKFNLPDRPKFTMPDKSKFKLPDRPKINFSAFTRNKENSQKEKTTDGSLTDSTSGSKRRKIEFDFRTYPRFARFKKDKKGGKTSKGERPGTPPPGFATVPRVTKDRQAVMSTSHWEDMSSNMSSEEPRHYGLPKDYPSDKDDFETKLAQVDKDYNQMQEEYERERMQNVAKVKLENAELWNAMEKNSAQRLEHRGSLPFYISGNAQSNEELSNTAENGDDESSAASTGHHRRGVLEEIDNDEFFLRQKGISQDNIEVGKYLSDEIRDAFRSPVNALNQLDNAGSFDRQKPHLYVEHLDPDNEEMFDDNIDKTELNEEMDHTHDIDHDDGYYTFPPVRPSRSRKQKALERAQLQQEPSVEIDDSINDIEEVPAPPMFQEPPPKREQEPEKVEASQRKSLFSSTFKEPEMLQNLNEYENEVDQTRDIPTIPKRRKKLTKGLSYSESGSLFNEPYDDDKWTKPKDQDDRMIDDEIIVHRMEYVMPRMDSELPEESPVAPRRMRSRSRGSRATSACDDDRTSRGAESITLDSHLPAVDNEWNLDDALDDPGYAIVEKPSAPKKSEPPPRPPAPVRRHRSSKSLSGDRQSADRQFFTVPRALKEATPPKRPSRNYSTLGPSRPPRKKSTTSLTDLNKVQQSQPTSTDTTQYVEIDDEEFDPHKDLQSGDVISKMKHRPLPPPPRPPRGPKRRKDPYDDKADDQDLQFVSNEDIDADFDLINSPENDLPLDQMNGGIDFEMPPLRSDELPIDDYDQEEIIEIEVSTQTDPLPDDFDYTIGMEEPFIDNEKQILTPQNESQADDVEENSIDAEILSRGLQRFRESSRPESRSSRPRTPSERPKTPIDRPKTPLDRMSPTAILVERRVSSPTRINERDVMVTEASLTVMPIDDSDSYETESKSTSSQKAIVRMEPLVHHEPIPEPKPDSIKETQIMPIQQEPIVKEEIIERIPSPAFEPTIESEPIIAEEPIVERIQIAQFGPLSQSEPMVRIETHPIPKPKVEKPEVVSNDSVTPQAVMYQTPAEPIPQITQVPQPDFEIYPRPIPREKPSEIWTALNNANIPTSPLPPMEVERVIPSTSTNIPLTQVVTQQLILKDPEVEVVKTQKLQVSDLDVERLSVGELQASKILVSEIEGLSLHVSDVNSKSGNIVVRNIEFAPEMIDEIVQKFAQLVPPSVPPPPPTVVQPPPPKSESTQQTQTDTPPEAAATPIHFEPAATPIHFEPATTTVPHPAPTIQEIVFEMQQQSPNLEFTVSGEAPERPPLPHMPGTAFPPGFYQDYSIPPIAFQRMRCDFSEGDPPLPSSRRRKHKREVVSSSEEEYRPTPRRAQPRTSNEPSVAELSSQLFRACQNSVSRTARYVISYITSQFGSGENKKDMQMALVIVLVMIAGLILLGVGDGRTVHHHHWDFFNPPNDK